MDSYGLSSLSRNDLELFLQRHYVDEATRARLEKLIDLRLQIGEIDGKLQGFGDEVNKITSDQKRLRENIEALSKTPEAKTLIERYIAKAGEQETQLEEMEKQRKTMTADKEKLEQELAVEIKNFEVK
jgi:chromosome segregation ATPase